MPREANNRITVPQGANAAATIARRRTARARSDCNSGGAISGVRRPQQLRQRISVAS